MDDKKNNGATGRIGEELACRYLMKAGHVILKRNWRCGHLEIDIISSDRNGTHFVEVKCRREPFQAEPQENVTYRKQKRITRAASAYLLKEKSSSGNYGECHFDIVSVTFRQNRESAEIRFFPDAWIPIFL